MKINCKYKFSEPFTKDPDNSGYDLKASKECFIPAGEFRLVETDLRIRLPKGYEAQVRGRSGLASKGILCHIGTIDNGYTGKIGVVLFNMSKKPLSIILGDRIAQLVVSPVITCGDIEFVKVDKLEVTDRGGKGFGSSGR